MYLAETMVKPLNRNKLSKRSSKLSAQQKKLLGDGLRAHYRIPLDLAGQKADPGCFRVKAGREIDMETGCVLPISDRKAREVRRTSKARAVARLASRGLVECGTEHGTWRLTKRGLTVAKALWPLLKPISKRELAHDIAFRDTIHEVLGPGARQRRRTRKAEVTAKVSGIEVEMDW